MASEHQLRIRVARSGPDCREAYCILASKVAVLRDVQVSPGLIDTGEDAGYRTINRQPIDNHSFHQSGERFLGQTNRARGKACNVQTERPEKGPFRAPSNGAHVTDTVRLRYVFHTPPIFGLLDDSMGHDRSDFGQHFCL
jgi:hypothetical protein